MLVKEAPGIYDPTAGRWDVQPVEMVAVEIDNPDSKVHGASMGPIWGRQDPGGPHVGPMNFAIWEPTELQGKLPAVRVNYTDSITLFSSWKNSPSYKLLLCFEMTITS